MSSPIRPAYRRGVKAYYRGADWAACPYPPGAERDAWHWGWSDAQVEHVESGEVDDE